MSIIVIPCTHAYWVARASWVKVTTESTASLDLVDCEMKMKRREVTEVPSSVKILYFDPVNQVKQQWTNGLNNYNSRQPTVILGHNG